MGAHFNDFMYMALQTRRTMVNIYDFEHLIFDVFSRFVCNGLFMEIVLLSSGLF